MHLIVGGDSLIGKELASTLSSRGAPNLATTRSARLVSDTRPFLDLAGSTDGFAPAPSVTYLCAAVTSIVACEDEPKASSAINITGTVALAEQLVSRGTFTIFLSTNLVFDGMTAFVAPNAAYNPLTEYGRQKAEAERRLLALGPSVAILRLSKVIGPDNALFAEWKERLARGETIAPFYDMTMSPVTAALAANALIRIGAARAPGVFQLSARRDMTYAEAARWLARDAGNLVIPSSARTAQVDPKAIPAHTTLDTSRLEREVGISAPEPEDALAPFLWLASGETERH